MAQPSQQVVTKEPKWVVSLNPNEFVNSAAISGLGGLVVAGTFFHPYSLPDAPDGTSSEPDEFGTYCFDSDGNQLWADKFEGYEGVYCVAISDDGAIAASGGWYSNDPYTGFVRAYATADGTRLFNYPVPGSRISVLAISADGTTLVAGAGSNLYLFQQSDGIFPTNPSVFAVSGTDNSVMAVSVSGDGNTIIMGDAAGNVYLFENNGGQLGEPYSWSSAELEKVHSVAMAPLGGYFAVVGYSQYAYLFSTDSIKNKEYVSAYDFGSASRVGWVAISMTGDFISAVRNDESNSDGFVYGLWNSNQGLVELWSQPTIANPNSTSVDFLGRYVTVSDGYEDAGHFYLFEAATGKPLWQYETAQMSWPMFISSSGTGIVAGSDVGSVYYFTPGEPESEN